MRKRVHRDAVRLQLARGIEREPLERRLRHAVRHETRERMQSRRGGHVDDRPLPAPLHVLRRQPRRLQRGTHVDVHDQVVAPHRQIEVAGEGDGGVVDQHVEAAEVVERGLHHLLDLGLVGEIGRHGQTAASLGVHLSRRVVDRPRQLERVSVRRPRRARDVRAGPRQRHRHRPADAAAGAGDQGHLSLEFHLRLRAPTGRRAPARRPCALLAPGTAGVKRAEPEDTVPK